MEVLFCLAGIAGFAAVIGGIFGLGWVVIGPLGVINRTRVKTARFQLLDLLLLVFLLQPSLAVFGMFMRDRFGRSDPTVVVIFLLVWGGTVAAWYGMTGALSKAGVIDAGKRAAAVLLILPMIGAVIPGAVFANLAMVVGFLENPHRNYDGLVAFGCALADIAFVAAIFGCRRVSRWIASGVAEGAIDKFAGKESGFSGE